jgi:hypothetical protein
MSVNGLHDDLKRAIALEHAADITGSQGNAAKTSEAAQLFYEFLVNGPIAKSVAPIKIKSTLRVVRDSQDT